MRFPRVSISGVAPGGFSGRVSRVAVCSCRSLLCGSDVDLFQCEYGHVFTLLCVCVCVLYSVGGLLDGFHVGVILSSAPMKMLIGVPRGTVASFPNHLNKASRKLFAGAGACLQFVKTQCWRSAMKQGVPVRVCGAYMHAFLLAVL